MAIVTPPDHIEWATHTAAEKTDPGTTLTADGWAVGDAPASSHFNHILNSAAGFASFVPKTIASTIAYGNIEFESGAAYLTSPWGHAAPKLVYCQLLRGRWYATVVTSADLVNIYDSPDGETWYAHNAIDGNTQLNDITKPVVSSDGIYAFGNDDKFYASTDATVENIKAGVSIGEIAQISDLTWDPVRKNWIAVGSNGSGAGRICHSSDGISWTTVASGSDATNEYLSVDCNPAGEILAVTDNLVSKMSNNGTGYTTGPTFSGYVVTTWWDATLDMFICTDDNADLHYVGGYRTDDVKWTEKAYFVARTPEFMWTLDTATNELTATFSYEGILGEFEDLGFWNILLFGAPYYNECLGGNGKLMFPYYNPITTRYERAVAYYGAQNDAI